MSNGQSQVVGTTATGGAVRRVLGSGGFSFGVIHKEASKQRGSGRPAGVVSIREDGEGNRLGYDMFTPEFNPTKGELGTLSQSGDTRTLASSGGYLKDDNNENIVVFDAEGNALGQLKWQARVSLIPMDTINKRKAEAKERAKKAKSAAA